MACMQVKTKYLQQQEKKKLKKGEVGLFIFKKTYVWIAHFYLLFT